MRHLWPSRIWLEVTSFLSHLSPCAHRGWSSLGGNVPHMSSTTVHLPALSSVPISSPLSSSSFALHRAVPNLTPAFFPSFPSCHTVLSPGKPASIASFQTTSCLLHFPVLPVPVGVSVLCIVTSPPPWSPVSSMLFSVGTWWLQWPSSSDWIYQYQRTLMRVPLPYTKAEWSPANISHSWI